ncbi:hypothetical protein [Planctomyces sp. SH-PL14]|uniref:hypothetical protein n=1 Tax=Planctomyces sp. SH-PL14 TaxID=1632864 RepID=UPI00078CBEA1|nr:hypothetical protein [Planctomyces sp. SH-PL14]AMV20629.1 hypothetical protein VT03_22205 [Planctomyces sp. SH-PL14]
MPAPVTSRLSITVTLLAALLMSGVQSTDVPRAAVIDTVAAEGKPAAPLYKIVGVEGRPLRDVLSEELIEEVIGRGGRLRIAASQPGDAAAEWTVVRGGSFRPGETVVLEVARIPP